MHAKFVQISSLVTKDGNIVLYALDSDGKIWEKIVADINGGWTAINS